MHSAKEYIEEHYHEPISLKDICRDLGLSESYVSHTFKDMLGYSPMQYALRCKIGEAQTLLISTDYSITEIARMVGFDAQSHFNQRFIKYVGISPYTWESPRQNSGRITGTVNRPANGTVQHRLPRCGQPVSHSSPKQENENFPWQVLSDAAPGSCLTGL